MTVGQVANQLGVSRSRVHQLDAELRPELCVCGRRYYDPDAVAALETRRATARIALSEVRRIEELLDE